MRFDLVFFCLLLLAFGALVAMRPVRRRPATTPPRIERESIEIRGEPDLPMGFGPRCAWIAVRAGDAQALAEALELSEIQPTNWRSGFLAIYSYDIEYVFVTPPVNGWVLAVGSLPDPIDPRRLPRWRALMSAVSQNFGEAWYFSTHRVSSYVAWALYVQGVEKRPFSYTGDVLWNSGQPLPEEAELMTTLYDPASPEAKLEGYFDREDLWMPGEEDVLKFAGAWSVDPSTFDETPGPPRVGLGGLLLD